MKAETTTAPPAAWTKVRERASLPSLRLMRWLALVAGRRVSRAVVHAVSLYIALFDRTTRRRSKAYLVRALDRPPTWRDVRAHVFAFLSTVLDRVYLLLERFDEFRFTASGAAAILDPVARGEGVLAFGAHLGSFEALRMIGREKGLRVAMIMYEDHAHMLNETLAVLAPEARLEPSSTARSGGPTSTPTLHTIALGRVDAMLAIRRWLDDGGVAGLLADRTVPGPSERSRLVAVPFLGKPALFPDGPFRMAAMLRRKVVFMAGLYRGGRDYDLRFFELADFSSLDKGGAKRDAAVRAGLVAYVEALETLCRQAPYNWFNFYDFWAGADDAFSAAAEPR